MPGFTPKHENFTMHFFRVYPCRNYLTKSENQKEILFMTPIYFPFTWADASTVQAITAVFPKIAVYHPLIRSLPSRLKLFEQAGNLEIRVPVTADSDKLEMLAADYQNWARLHQGSDLAFLKIRQPDAPFMDHLSSRIQSEILHYQETAPDQSGNSVFNARLFLEIAATYDAQQTEINCDLSNIRNMEKRFMAALGDPAEMEAPASLGNLPLTQDDPREYMLSERLQAWSTLFLQDSRCTDAGLWVTSRASVIEWIQDEVDMAPVLEINCIPIHQTIDDSTRFWQESILTYLSQLQKTPWPSAVKTFEPPSSDYAWENAVSVKGFIIPNQTPSVFFRKLAAVPEASSSSLNIMSSKPAMHTIAIYISTL
jgi:hypothetical protein